MKTSKRILSAAFAVIIMTATLIGAAPPVLAAAPATNYQYIDGYYTDYVHITVPSSYLPDGWSPSSMTGLKYEGRWAYTDDDGSTYMVYDFLVTGGGSASGTTYTYSFKGYYSEGGDGEDDIEYTALVVYLTLFDFPYPIDVPDPDPDPDPDPSYERLFEVYYVGDVATLVYCPSYEFLKNFDPRYLTGLEYIGRESYFSDDYGEDVMVYKWNVVEFTEATVRHTFEIYCESESDDPDEPDEYLSRTVTFDLLRYRAGENSYWDKYQELCRQFAKDGQVDYFALVSYLLSLQDSVDRTFYRDGYDKGYKEGYLKGHADGLSEAVDNDPSFYKLLQTIIVSPITAMRSILNFEIPMPGGGVFNVWPIVSFVITMAIVFIVVGYLWRKK